MTICKEEQTSLYCVAHPQVFELSEEAVSSDSMKINHSLTLWLQLTNPELNDLIFILFPWGERDKDFTGKEWGQAIDGQVSRGWSIHEADNSKWGRHWILKPSFKEGKVEVRFENINFLTAGIGCVLIRYRKETKEGEKRDFCYQIPILKKKQSLRILQFDTEKRTVKPGEDIRLCWKVTGADSLVLNPGNIPLDLAGTRTVYANHSTVYTLCARRREQTVSRELEIYVGGDEEKSGS